MQRFIVDGYNVIHADPELKKTVRFDLQSARRELVQRLKRYLEAKNVRLTVVFDGHGGITDVDVEIPGRLQLVYSPAGETADALILAMLEDSANPRGYVVVTSDMADIGRAARSMGASVLSSDEFLSRIGPVPPDGGAPGEAEDTDDVDYWIERFDSKRKVDPQS